MDGKREPQWDETDCFWCGAIYNAARDVCPMCASDILTGPIEIIDFKDDGERDD